MLTEYIRAAMNRARYEIIEDGSCYGEIAGFRGVWADAATLEACRLELQDVLEDRVDISREIGSPLPR